MSAATENKVTAYLGLGGNLGDAVQTLRSARKAIGSSPGIRELACSSLYRSEPLGPSDQPEYVNAVMAVATSLEPLELLRTLQGIENAHGRVRTGERWGPRTLDLDILLYDEIILDSEELTIPHPGLAQREFVLYPLAEIAPDLYIPKLGWLRDLVRDCPRRGLRVLAHD
ncbi:MAG TPA: 2-amino-4-hydroxy-6-hydroxymethyldihydropteridine diphosphokinase [Methylococcus sp.]|nr:2-amino-4-hydroxy-6-hydroxymethyldihydropteridine diphosphokinase [Methylococcus sp.]